MAEREDDLPGMGSSPRGPSFVPSSAPGEPPAESLRPPGPPVPLGPSRSVRPTVISVAIIVLVAAVVAVASLVAYRSDITVAAPARPSIPPPVYSSSPDRIDFVTADGSGQLIMRTRSWLRDGEVPPVSGYYLRVEIELICTEGEVDYDPYLFQAFDRSGRLVEMSRAGTGGQVLSVGTLVPGQSVRGVIAFDIARGEVTLLMSDDSDNTVTALRVPD